MPKRIPDAPKHTAVAAHTDELTTVVYADAVALGEATLTSVNITVNTKECGRVTVSKGTITAVASAEAASDGTLYADAITDVTVAGADFISIRMTDHSGGDGVDSCYDISETNFKIMALPLNRDEPMVLHRTQVEYDDTEDPIYLDGNVAFAIFDAQALGDNTLVTVDAYTLAIEDELSLSTVMITSAVS